jgi:hypothetical protein
VYREGGEIGVPVEFGATDGYPAGESRYINGRIHAEMTNRQCRMICGAIGVLAGSIVVGVAAMAPLSRQSDTAFAGWAILVIGALLFAADYIMSFRE